jgi:hypothetical protein
MDLETISWDGFFESALEGIVFESLSRFQELSHHREVNPQFVGNQQAALSGCEIVIPFDCMDRKPAGSNTADADYSEHVPDNFCNGFQQGVCSVRYEG